MRLAGRHEVVGSNPCLFVKFLAENIPVLSGVLFNIIFKNFWVLNGGRGTYIRARLKILPFPLICISILFLTCFLLISGATGVTFHRGCNNIRRKESDVRLNIDVMKLFEYVQPCFKLWHYCDGNKTRTSKVGAIHKAQKAQSFENMLGTIVRNSRKPLVGAFSARKTLQKFGYSVLRQIRAYLWSYASSSVKRNLFRI